MSIFPFRMGEWYSVGRLREVAKAISDRTRSDKEFRHAMRENDQRRVAWAKTWMEEIYPSSLLADRLGLADDSVFCWTPNGAADVEFRTTGRAIKIQCTTAYPHWPNSLGKQGGQLHKLEMRELNERGYMFPGGGVSNATAHNVGTDLETLRVAIADALAKKSRPTTAAAGCSFTCAARPAPFWISISAKSWFRRPTASAERRGRRHVRGYISSATSPRTLLKFEATEDNRIGWLERCATR